MNEIKIISNNVPRDIIDGEKLTEEERKEFDYIDWTDGYEHSFFRYKGNLYDVNDCEPIFRDTIQAFKQWSGIFTETFFSGVVFRYVNNMDQVIVGRYYT